MNIPELLHEEFLDYRTLLESDLPKCALMKLDRPESESKCYNFLPSAELLHDSKKATNT